MQAKKPGAAAWGRRLYVSPGKIISAHDLASAGPSGAKRKKVEVPARQASPSDSEISGISELSDPNSPDAELPQVEADEVPVEGDAAQPEQISVGDYVMEAAGFTTVSRPLWVFQWYRALPSSGGYRWKETGMKINRQYQILCGLLIPKLHRSALFPNTTHHVQTHKHYPK